MALRNILYTSDTYLQVAYDCATEICLCLDSSWASKTVSGRPFATAVVAVTTPVTVQGTCPSTPGCDKTFTYTLAVDDIQFIENPATPGIRYQLLADDILELFPHCCTLDRLLDLIVGPAPIPPPVPEHTTTFVDGLYIDLPAVDVSAVGNYPGNPSPITVVNNPSLDRDMDFLLNLVFATVRSDESGFRGVDGYISENGGPFVLAVAVAQGPFGIARDVYDVQPLNINVTIPAGGSYSFQTRVDIVTLVASTPGDSSVYKGIVTSHNSLGSTV